MIFLNRKFLIIFLGLINSAVGGIPECAQEGEIVFNSKLSVLFQVKVWFVCGLSVVAFSSRSYGPCCIV